MQGKPRGIQTAERRIYEDPTIRMTVRDLKVIHSHIINEPVELGV
jgi:hypothetical protein